MKPGWTISQLAEIAELERDSVDASAIASGTMFVGLENITSNGEFLNVRKVESGELASSKFAFTQKHLLYGKLRPYLAKIARPDFTGICSTDILPVLPGPNLSRDFLFYYLRQPVMIDLANSLATGANLPRLSPRALAEFKIPLPPLPEQRRIAEVLDRAEALRAKRRAALAQLDTLTQAIFLDMFGDPATNPKRWPLVRLTEVLTDAKPGFACGEDPPDGVFQFRMNNVTTEGHLDYSKKRRVPRDTKNLKAFLVLPGDVLFNATNSPDLVGKSAYFPGYDEPAVFSNHFLRLRPRSDKLDGRSLAQWLALQFRRRVFQNMCKQWVNQATVARDLLLKLHIAVPPLEFQYQFTRRIAAVEKLKIMHGASLAELVALFAALQHRAFRGEL